jgi:myo-inositol-1(or 4)-monophosphatase
MTQSEEQELLAVALEAARAASSELRSRYGRRRSGVRAKSGPTDLVSDADIAAESAVRTVLAARRPDDAILGEEGGETGDGSLRWVVDPLDGTINYLYEIPAFAVSVAVQDAAGTIAGAVIDPVREEIFAGTRSGAPTLNDAPLPQRPNPPDSLAVAMIATGFGYDQQIRTAQAEVVARLLPRIRDIRRVGAAALDLAWSAIGRFDAFYERGLHSWDMAAGALVAERSGLVVRELPEADGQPWGVMTAPANIADELYELIVG